MIEIKLAAISLNPWRKPFQISKQVGNLPRLKHEFRHIRMADNDSLGERFLQIVDMSFRRDRSKFGRGDVRAAPGLADGVTSRAEFFGKPAARPFVLGAYIQGRKSCQEKNQSWCSKRHIS
jgi:hypothetical protein